MRLGGCEECWCSEKEGLGDIPKDTHYKDCSHLTVNFLDKEKKDIFYLYIIYLKEWISNVDFIRHYKLVEMNKQKGDV